MPRMCVQLPETIRYVNTDVECVDLGKSYGVTKVTIEQQQLWLTPEKWKVIHEKKKRKCHLYTSRLMYLLVTVNSY